MPNSSISRERPRVVHLSTDHRAGDVRIFERECRSLAATNKYDVFLAAPGRIPDTAGVSLIPLVKRPNSRVRRFATVPPKAWALTRTIDADLWHFHDLALLPIAVALARRGHKVIWDAHEDFSTQFTASGAKSWVPGPLRGAIRAGTNSMLNRIDRTAVAVVVATPTIAAHYSNPRTVVVGNEARLEDFAHVSPDPKSNRILYTGPVARSHMFPELVQALVELPGIRLSVAGGPPEDEKSWNWAKSVLGPRLEHLGWLDRAGLAREMGRSSLGAALYAPTPNYMALDISPTKFFEFAAAGLPTLGPPIPRVKELLAESGGGFLCQDFSAAEIRDAIIQAGDPVAWQNASESARRWAQKSGGWTQSEARLLALYSDVLGAGA